MAGEARWTKVDAIDRPSNISDDDQCLFLHLYTPGMGYSYSEANQLVLNYKTELCKIRSNPKRKYYKDMAIEEYASELVHLFVRLTTNSGRVRIAEMGKAVAFVPIPPSVPLGHEDYDDRNARTCKLVCDRLGFSYCRDIETDSYIGSSHQGGSRDPVTIKRTLVRSSLGANNATYVFQIDDTLVSGAHFVACRDFLLETGCQDSACGVFLARSVRE